ncbi:3-oxoacyl-ACP synthase [Aquimarina mytili]|uniref:3-oxoacyl-ACP synthase n=1 Tax=Aquimarina mytili TaxID=874423 RepID=A0A936ZZS1_9FLAO|nr:3-oxoacyl-ACP synthase [Aquimarina mytili]MBL0685371.1 3-oxoacyl-ACP synthase [Aquimarina mytili]
MNIEDIKQELLNQCKNHIDQRLQRIQNTITDIQESLNSETKSTAGDKHETGRAMLQLEREKAGKQLAEVQKLQYIVGKIDISSSEPVRLGSLVSTSQDNYFLSISAGKIDINNESYYAVATNSPIGQLLLGKSKDDTIQFRGKHIHIKTVR